MSPRMVRVENVDEEFPVLFPGSIDQMPIIIDLQDLESYPTMNNDDFPSTRPTRTPLDEKKLKTGHITSNPPSQRRNIPTSIRNEDQFKNSPTGTEPSLLNRSLPERKRSNKVRFVDTAKGDRPRPGSDHYNQGHNGKPRTNTDKEADFGRKHVRAAKQDRESYRTEDTKGDKPDSGRKRETIRGDAKRSPPSAYQHPSLRPPRPRDEESRRLSLQFPADDEEYHERSDSKQEWYSDDELSSSYRGTHLPHGRQLNHWPQNSRSKPPSDHYLPGEALNVESEDSNDKTRTETLRRRRQTVGPECARRLPAREDTVPSNNNSTWGSPDYAPADWHYPPPGYSYPYIPPTWTTTPYVPYMGYPIQPPYGGQHFSPGGEARGEQYPYWNSTIPPHHPAHQHQYEDGNRVSLLPCPRPISIAGYTDWSTLAGLPHLDICPSCATQVGSSPFRHLLTTSQPKPSNVTVRCSFSEPWIRLAWVQTLKLRLNHLELLYLISRPPPSCRPCQGPVPSIRTWYKIIDPETRRVIPDFTACASCFRNVEILLPSLHDSFETSPNVHKSTCDFHTSSPRFIRYLDLLDAAVAKMKYGQQKPDLREFIRYAMRKSTMYDCPRDRSVVGHWHYIPELPELTVCEDCYDDVVWPQGNDPIASLVSRTVQLLPETGSRSSRGRAASCQLYSPRMRTKFHDAVRTRDFEYLRASVLARYAAETTFRQKKKILLEDVSKGYDRDAELRKNAEDWKRYE
ncbi:hypothetical protein FQN57_003203 [Myotisia sp. PD_48]|nr:hypothetical protein FQN57_003203 [Myotisia sp. PD_48]